MSFHSVGSLESLAFGDDSFVLRNSLRKRDSFVKIGTACGQFKDQKALSDGICQCEDMVFWESFSGDGDGTFCSNSI